MPTSTPRASWLRFPTMLRKMWSGGEVQAWLDEQAPACSMDDAALAELYRRANGEDIGKAQPLTTQRIFRAMRLAAAPADAARAENARLLAANRHLVDMNNELLTEQQRSLNP